MSNDDLHDFMLARQLAGQKRIRKDFLHCDEQCTALALQLLGIDLVDGGKREHELRRQRALVVLD